jgi:hypothetical protein
MPKIFLLCPDEIPNTRYPVGKYYILFAINHESASVVYDRIHYVHNARL